jgi:hypothetical protein
MGKYTFTDSVRVDAYIDEYLNRVIDSIFNYFPRQQVRSILLAGSYGKGEGSVLLTENYVKPLRDFDICIIVPKGKIPSALFVKNLQNKLRAKFSSISDYSYQLTGDQLPEISITTLENINSLPDIASYDLKKCKILYGEDIRPQIKWDINDIPLRTNGRALFQKLIALIGAFHSEYLDSGVPEDLQPSFTRETSRIYIEICTGLCLLSKVYDSSAVNRLNSLRRIYRRDFRELCNKIPDLVDKVEASTLYKLDPSKCSITNDPIDYWFNTRKDLGLAIQYYFERYLGIPFSGWESFCAILERRLKESYYLPVVSAFFENKSIKLSGSQLRFLNLLFNIRENLAYSEQTLKKGSFSLSILKGLSSPSIKVFVVSPLILFAINRSGKINEEYVKLALKKLNFVKQNNQPFQNRWNEARSKLLDLVFSINMI